MAAEAVQWDWAPSGINQCSGRALDKSQAKYVTGVLGSNVTKARFIEYTDGNFTVPKARPPHQQHLALLGPLLHAQPGDTITVHLLNRLPFAVNLEPSGILYETPSTAQPGETAVYTWRVPEEAAPAAGGQDGTTPSSRLWLYRSTVGGHAHTHAGLVGPLVVAALGELDRREGRPRGIDFEAVLVMHVIHEDESPFFEANIRGGALDLGDALVAESLLKHTINGRLYCHVDQLRMALGHRVRWYVAGLGSEADALHTAHWHGITLMGEGGHRTDQIVLQSGSMAVLDSLMDNAGTWLLHCHVADHMMAGMTALFTADGDPSGPPSSQLNGPVREYFLAAEVMTWDYAPSGHDLCSSAPHPYGSTAAFFLRPRNQTPQAMPRLGSRYTKALYLQYTDATFTTRKERDPEWEHLGLLGPLLRAEVGDTLRVTLLNRVPGHNVSLHPHGVWYSKASEGAPYNDGTGSADRMDDSLGPGARWTYTWHVPERAGPGPGDPSSVLWLYHSHMSEALDNYAGLWGPLLVTRRGDALPDGSPRGVHREVILGFSIMDEGASFLLGANLAAGLPQLRLDPGDAGGAVSAGDAAAQAGTEFSAGSFGTATAHGAVNSAAAAAASLLGVNAGVALASIDEAGLDLAAAAKLMADPGFRASLMMHSINGYMFCNMPRLELEMGAPTRVHFASLGSSADMHTPRFNAPGVLMLRGRQQQALQLLPGSMLSADVEALAPGEGLVTCSTQTHQVTGMMARFRVSPPRGDRGSGSGVAAAAEAAAAVAGTGAGDAGGETGVREYWLEAVKVDWDYAPLGLDGCTGREFEGDQLLWTKTTQRTMGTRYAKAIFRLTDPAGVPLPSDPFSGLVGPLLRVEEGERLVVHLTNKLDYSIGVHVMGGLLPLTEPAAPAAAAAADNDTSGGRRRLLQYAAAGSDAAAPSGAASSRDRQVGWRRRQRRRLQRRLRQTFHPDADDMIALRFSEPVATMYSEAGVVEHSSTVTLQWLAPALPAEGPDAPPVRAYTYASAVDLQAHLNAGLVGAVLVYRPGHMPAAAASAASASKGAGAQAREPRTPPPPLEVPLWFAVVDETVSPYLQDNINDAQHRTWHWSLLQDRQIYPLAPEFVPSNQKHAINGRMWCNLPPLNLTLGSSVRFIAFGTGTEVDIHMPIVGGQALRPLGSGSVAGEASNVRRQGGGSRAGANVAGVGVMPGTAVVVDMVATSVGRWQLRCATLDHAPSGMVASVVVTPPP